jgi:hypothetical protein
MDLDKLLSNIDAQVVIRVAPPLGVPTIYGPFPNRDAATTWVRENCIGCNAYIGKVYHPDDVKQHTLVNSDGSNIR